ncbi:Hypp3575 [Branchiostoma lanceolatum]|uniref:Hypp3575 protein n=1 Tax=Branchiostoma lanceolatum TaxID=7740 RepID=A0A8K0EUR4_BRALA|nr:Hypp3575 [Branchiostoma lanceolatum]
MDKGPTIRDMLQLTESATYEEVYGAYSAFVQKNVNEDEHVKKLKPADKKSYYKKNTGTGEQFSKVSASFLSFMENHRNEDANPLDKGIYNVKAPSHWALALRRHCRGS